MAFEDGFSTRNRASKLCLALVLHQVEQRFLLPALRRADFDALAALFAEQFFQHFAVFEIHRHVNLGRNVLLIQINLLQQGGEELGLIELRLVFPEELAPVDNLSVAQVEQVERHQRRLGVAGEDIDVVALGRGHLLPLLDLFHRGEQIAQRRRPLRSASLRAAASMRARRPRARSVWRPSRKSRTSRTAACVGIVGGQPFDARPQAAVNVILQAGLGMKAREIHLARGHHESGDG